MSDDWAEHESGPFCRHWDDPSDCQLRCICGHLCRDHFVGNSTKCYECDCAEWREQEMASHVLPLVKS